MVPQFLFGVKEEEFLVKLSRSFFFIFIISLILVHIDYFSIVFILWFIEHLLHCMLDIIMQVGVLFCFACRVVISSQFVVMGS